MYRNRIIPCLLVKDGYLVKTQKFKNPTYIGDPINAVKIFNDKEVDELFFIDISATKNGFINYDLLKKISNQSFMPLGYGGGISSIDEIKKILFLGFEKISLSEILFKNIKLVSDAAKIFGSQSIVAVINIKRNLFGKYKLYSYKTKKFVDIDPVFFCQNLEKYGIGEIIINDVDNDGIMKGYDLDLIKLISNSVSVPVISLGGAGKLDDFKLAIDNGASAASAGSMFVFYGKHKAVLINYPEEIELNKLLKND